MFVNVQVDQMFKRLEDSLWTVIG